MLLSCFVQCLSVLGKKRENKKVPRRRHTACSITVVTCARRGGGGGYPVLAGKRRSRHPSLSLVPVLARGYPSPVLVGIPLSCPGWGGGSYPSPVLTSGAYPRTGLGTPLPGTGYPTWDWSTPSPPGTGYSPPGTGVPPCLGMGYPHLAMG